MLRNELTALRKLNRARQKNLQRQSVKTVGLMMDRMDTARMGAFDREVVRKDLISMALEAEQRGNPLPDELDDDLTGMSERIAAEVGRADPLERQTYWLMMISAWGFVPSLLALTQQIPLHIFTLLSIMMIGALFIVCISGVTVFKSRRKPIHPLIVLAGLELFATYFMFQGILNANAAMQNYVWRVTYPGWCNAVAYGMLLLICKRKYDSIIHEQAALYNWAE